MKEELFGFYKLNEAGMARTQLLSKHFEELLEKCARTIFNESEAMEVLSGASPRQAARQWALLKTKLEEACFYSKKTSSMQQENQA